MITITNEARSKIRHILDEAACGGLRISVRGGGCSGFQYGFQLDSSAPAEDDTTVDLDGVLVLVDAMSLMYLDNATIDYKESLMGSQFVLDNPNVKATCGCGSSFTMD